MPFLLTSERNKNNIFCCVFLEKNTSTYRMPDTFSTKYNRASRNACILICNIIFIYLRTRAFKYWSAFVCSTRLHDTTLTGVRSFVRSFAFPQNIESRQGGCDWSRWEMRMCLGAAKINIITGRRRTNCS